jgi:Uma2 family endonuclease
MNITTHLMTSEELIKLPRGQFRYELVKGELLTMSPSGYEHCRVIMKLATPLSTYAIANRLGEVIAAELGFKLESDPDTVLAPDISFIKEGRLDGKPQGYPKVVPDLVVEVISPSERKSKVIRKTELWLAFGVKSVWLIKPQTRTIEIFSANRPRRVLSESDVLVDDVVPGFEIPVSVIFE